jgi:glutaminyl-tRNA synthetase
VLRGKIDLETQNMNMRDPVLYRIRYAPHHRTGNAWCIYPMYDYAHPLSDAIEEITHSICTLEFESHRPLYDWCIRETEMFPSRQIEFARLNLTYTVMSKRKLAELVQRSRLGLGRSTHADPGGAPSTRLHARGDPRRSVNGSASAKTDSLIDVGLLEHGLRDDLNRARRA